MGEYTRNYRAAKRGNYGGREGGELRGGGRGITGGEGGELRGEGGELHQNERKSKKKCDVSKVDFRRRRAHLDALKVSEKATHKSLQKLWVNKKTLWERNSLSQTKEK